MTVPSNDRVWYRGIFGAIAPIWVSDPEGECFIVPRGILGYLLMPLAELFHWSHAFMGSWVNPYFEPYFLIQYAEKPEMSSLESFLRDEGIYDEVRAAVEERLSSLEEAENSLDKR